MVQLSSDWNNEAYVSLHLVQPMLEMAGLPRKSSYSHWIPEFKVKVPKLTANSQIVWTQKEVDFLVEDLSRYINFLVEIKTAKTRLDAAARIQLETYLKYSNTRFGILIDPFLVEIYEYTQGLATLKCKHNIENPEQVQPVANFVRNFLETVKMRTIAIYTAKGGVGKTTLVVNIAYELAKIGNRVLVVDLDEQANASLSLGVNKADELDNATNLKEFVQILDSLKERKELINFLKEYDQPGFKPNEYIQPSALNKILSLHNQTNGKIDVLPSSYQTTDSSILSLGLYCNKKLDNALRKTGLSKEYDYVIIDTPPSLTAVSQNGLLAAQYIIIPSQMEYFSVYAIRRPIKNAEEIHDDTDGRRGNILGIIPMMVENVNLHTTIKSLVSKVFKDIPLLPEIKRATAVGQASHERKPLSLFAEQNRGASSVATQFSNLTKQIVKQIDHLERNSSK
ncbi:AAA family ATPase [Microcoleus vaginatus GB1-A2]|uniref:AAA family ATPase n=1 Tax=Microcoleus vaginatus TaxID=119532 RepID=UPI0016851EEA|nr:AAA family ATPase [Microcoleus sp. FACHB-61]